jgi:hypothetical protein
LRIVRSKQVRASLVSRVASLDIGGHIIVVVVRATVVIWLGFVGSFPDGCVRKKANEKTKLILKETIVIR